MVSQNSEITIVALLLLGSLMISATTSLLEDIFLSSQHHEKNWDDSFNPVEQVNITMIGYDNLIHSELALFHYPSVISLREIENSLPKLETIDMTIHRMGDKRDIILLLVKHKTLISKDFSLKYQNDDGLFKTEFLNDTLPFFNPEHCYFATLPENIIAASINLCEGISGYIQFGSEEHDLSSVRRDNSTDDHFISTKFVANSTIDPDILLEKFKLNKNQAVQNHISKRDLDDIWSPIPLYYEIYFVVDYSLAQEEIYKSPQLLLKHIFYLVSLANAYFVEFNLGLVLKTIDIWSDRPRLHPNLTHICATKEGGFDLNAKTWVYEFLKYQWYNDTDTLDSDIRVVLLSRPPPECKTVGISGVGALCSINSTVVVSKVPSLFYTAIILTHEIGHNLGASHLENMTDHAWCRDILTQENGEDPCYNQTETADIQCIMPSYHHTVPQEKKAIYFFSKCSKRRIGWNLLGKKGNCMQNIPSSDTYYHTCGNLLAEPGEQCDAGYYGNECCTAHCKLIYADANCYKGSCCNMTSCRLLPSSVTCREAEDEFCDVPEKCDGINPECPRNIHRPTGYLCNNMGPAFCVYGKCRSHSSQCADIWKGSYAAHDSCYDLNRYTNASGNCGYGLEKGVYIFRPCTGRFYQTCGLLQCEVSASELESLNKTQFLQPHVVDLGGRGKVCTSVMLRPKEVAKYEFDPTQVPSGARCGPHHTCYSGYCYDLLRPHGFVSDNFVETHTSQVPDIPAPTIETTTEPPSSMEPEWPSEIRITRKSFSSLTEKDSVEYYTTASDDFLITTIPAEILADRRGVGSDGIFFVALIGVPLVMFLVLVTIFAVDEVLRRRNYTQVTR